MAHGNFRTDDRGDFDLPSIFSSVVVTLIILGVVAATALLLIPWQQNYSAKTVLTTVATAQTNASTTHGNYVNLDGLQRRGTLGKSSDINLDVRALTTEYQSSQKQSVTGVPSGKHYVAFVESATGDTFYISDTQDEPQKLTP